MDIFVITSDIGYCSGVTRTAEKHKVVSQLPTPYTRDLPNQYCRYYVKICRLLQLARV